MGLKLGKALKKIGKAVTKGVAGSVKKLHQSAFKLTQAGFYAATGQMNKARQNLKGAFQKLKESYDVIKATSREAMQTIMQNKLLGTVFNVACAVVQPWGAAMSLAARAVAGVPLKFKDLVLTAAQTFAPQITSWVSSNLGAVASAVGAAPTTAQLATAAQVVTQSATRVLAGESPKSAILGSVGGALTSGLGDSVGHSDALSGLNSKVSGALGQMVQDVADAGVRQVSTGERVDLGQVAVGSLAGSVRDGVRDAAKNLAAEQLKKLSGPQLNQLSEMVRHNLASMIAHRQAELAAAAA